MGNSNPNDLLTRLASGGVPGEDDPWAALDATTPEHAQQEAARLIVFASHLLDLVEQRSSRGEHS